MWYTSGVSNALMSKSIPRETQVTMEGIARKLAEGKDVQKIATETNLDVPTIDGFIGREEFHEVFRSLDPKAYQRWQDDKADLAAHRAVRNMARADAVEYYKLARDLVRSGDLKDTERLSHLFTLLKVGGVMDKEQVEERVSLSEGSLDLLKETLTEMDEFFRR